MLQQATAILSGIWIKIKNVRIIIANRKMLNRLPFAEHVRVRVLKSYLRLHVERSSDAEACKQSLLIEIVIL